MRDIKFRGKDDIYGWVYGSLITLECDGKKYYQIIDKNGKSYIVNYDSVGQYIGIEDSNNKEIYEGDIIEDYRDILFEVTGCKNNYGYTFCFSSRYDYDPDSINKIKIVGNSYDDPDLLLTEYF
jgi:hypothetical protein